MSELTRSHCVLSREDDLEHLYTFPSFPVFMGCSDSPASSDLHAPMSWWIGKNSGFIQLKELVPLDILYPESHGAGEVGLLWRRHHAALADFLAESNPGEVFEIGGAHGILETEHRRHREIPWTILEPNPHPTDQTHAKFLRGFFDKSFRYSGSFDTVVHSHLFEHVYDPVDFMDALSAFSPIGTRLVFSVPNMLEMLKRKYTNCVNFEHTFLLTEPFIEYLLARAGFEIERKQLFEEDHSIFFHAVRRAVVASAELPAGLYEKHRALYLEYVLYHEKLVEDLNQKLRMATAPSFVFGAHVFTQYLIAFGLDTSRLSGILDNDPSKAGRRLYGTNLSVQSPAVLADLSEVNVILKAGVYNNEIRRDILENHNPACAFFE